MLNQLLISNAFAQVSETAATATTGDSPILSFVPLILIFAVFYFLIVRPQSKKMKEHQTMLGDLKSGNKVVTSGGIVGIIRDIDQKGNQVELEIADGVRIKILKNHIADLAKEEKK